MKAIVACMVSATGVDFSLALATAVVETALRQEDVLSVQAAWTRVDCTPYAR